MIKRFRAYLSFTPLSYKVVILLLYQAGLLLFRVFTLLAYRIIGVPDSWLLQRTNFEFSAVFFLMELVSVVIIFYVEAISDIGVFFGAYSKNGGLPEYLRMSKNGGHFFMLALQGDLIRRAILIAVYFIPGIFVVQGLDISVTGERLRYILMAAGCALLSYGMSALSLFVTRHINNRQVMPFVVMIFFFVLTGFIFYINDNDAIGESTILSIVFIMGLSSAIAGTVLVLLRGWDKYKKGFLDDASGRKRRKKEIGIRKDFSASLGRNPLTSGFLLGLYTPQAVSAIVTAIIFLAIGILAGRLEFANSLSAFFICFAFIEAPSGLVTIGVSTYCASSPKREALQCKMPALVYLISSLIGFIVASLFERIKLWTAPENEVLCAGNLMFTALFIMVIGAFMGIIYKAWVFGFIMMAAVSVLSFNAIRFVREGIAVFPSLGLFRSALVCGFIACFVGAVLLYLFSKLFRRFPLTERLLGKYYRRK